MQSHPYQKAMKFMSLAKKSQRQLESYSEKHNGDSVYIIGTGPSVSNFNFELLNSHSVIFLNNAITLNKYTSKCDGKYAVITDFIRMRELRPQIIDLDITTFCSSDKIFNPIIGEYFFTKPMIFIMPKISYSSQSRSLSCTTSSDFMVEKDLRRGVYLGKSVVFPAIQLAWYMGFKKIHLVGIDMTSNKGEYFDKSIKGHWAGFCYETDGKKHFSELRDKLRADNVEIFDHSKNGANDQILKFKYFEN